MPACYSPLVLAATMLGLALVYLAPVMVALFAWGVSQLAGWLAWISWLRCTSPCCAFTACRALGIGAAVDRRVLCRFTLQSAIQHWSGKGGMWKDGRKPMPEGASRCREGASMSSVAELQSGKGHNDENFLSPPS